MPQQGCAGAVNSAGSGVFRDYGVTHLSGVIGVDAAAILREVSEAGGTRFFMKWSKKINLVVSS